MSDSTANLRRTIGSATDLQAVVRTMKALAASSIGQYERSVLALNDYRRSIDQGLGACLRAAIATATPSDAPRHAPSAGPITAIVFGSDQGLVGPFNEVIADHALARLAALGALPGEAQCWAVGERVRERLVDLGLPVLGRLELPASVKGIAPLVGRLQVESEAHRARVGSSRVYVFHNAPSSDAVFAPVDQRLLPLDAAWQRDLAGRPWPTGSVPEAVFDLASTLLAFVREHLFISLYRACAESLASENASRLAAMQRADTNFDELLHGLHRRFDRVRQTAIDDELFDVTAGFNALS